MGRCSAATAGSVGMRLRRRDREEPPSTAAPPTEVESPIADPEPQASAPSPVAAEPTPLPAADEFAADPPVPDPVVTPPTAPPQPAPETENPSANSVPSAAPHSDPLLQATFHVKPPMARKLSVSHPLHPPKRPRPPRRLHTARR